MPDYSSFLNEVANDIRADSYDGVRFHFLSECLKRGIIPEVPSHWFDEGRGTPFPPRWTASELTIFDNGEVSKSRKKRDRVRTTKTRFAAIWKAWSSAKVQFSKPAPWHHTASFYHPTAARAVVRQLEGDGCLDAATVELVDEVCSNVGLGGGCLIGLVRRQNPKVGTIWVRGHLIVLVLENDFPSTAAIVTDTARLKVEFENEDAAGQPLTNRAVAQARLATNDAFDRWHNQSQLY
ncbi:MAG: hypothetical protein ABL931_00180 [Usitatibacteraceae bacterium]